MQIHVTARHCEIGPELRSYAEQRLSKLNKYDAAIREVRVIVSHERKLHTVELTVHVHQQDIIITESHMEPGAALEIAPRQRSSLSDWHRRRSAHVAAGRSRLEIGHVDLVGWL